MQAPPYTYNDESDGSAEDDEPPVVKEGWLHKADPDGNRWKRRWCALTDVTFCYYDSPTKRSESLKGGFETNRVSFSRGFDATKAKRKLPTNFVFNITTPDRVFYFCADTAMELQEWESAITMVLGLQAEYETFSGGDVSQDGSYPAPETDQPLAAPPAPEPEPEPEVPPGCIRIQVTAPEEDKTYALVIKEAKAATMTVAKIKRTLARHGQAVDGMVLMSGSTVLQDTWTGAEVGLRNGHDIIIVPASSAAATAPAPAVFTPDADSTRSASTPPTAAAVEPASAPSAAPVGAAPPVPAPAPTPAPTPAAAAPTPAAPAPHHRPPLPVAFAGGSAGAPKPPRAPAAASVPTPAPASPPTTPATDAQMRLHRRLQLRRIFMQLQQRKTDTSEPVPRRLFHDRLVGTPSAMAFLSSGSVLGKLLDESSGPSITWAEFSALLAQEKALTAATPPVAVVPGAPAPAGTSTSEGVPPHEDEVMVVLVEVAHGEPSEIEVTARTDPHQLAMQFITEKHLDMGQYRAPLVAEIEKVVQQLRDRAHLGANGTHTGMIDAPVPVPPLPQDPEVMTDEERLRSQLIMTIDVEDGSIDLTVTIGDDPETLAQQFADEHGVGDDGEFVDELVSEIRKSMVDVYAAEVQHLRQERYEAQVQASSAHNELSQRLAAVKRERDVLAAAPTPAPAAAPAPAPGTTPSGVPSLNLDAEFASADRDKDGIISRDEWRAWAKQKKELLAQFNAERAALIAETRRLRTALDPKQRDVEARFRRMDEDRARLAGDLAAAQTARSQAEAELRSIVKQWEADGRRWAAERKRLSDQVGSATGLSPSTALSSSRRVPTESAVSAGAEVERLKAERRLILKNWSEETDILVTIWREDKESWTAQKEAHKAKVESLQRLLAEAEARLSSQATTPAAPYSTPSGYKATPTAVAEVSPLGAAVTPSDAPASRLAKYF